MIDWYFLLQELRLVVPNTEEFSATLREVEALHSDEAKDNVSKFVEAYHQVFTWQVISPLE